jgi:hypothetical protein
MGKKSISGSGMNIPHHISEGLETIFWVKNIYALMRIGIRNLFDPRSGSAIEELGSGIRDKHPGSATLVLRIWQFILGVRRFKPA